MISAADIAAVRAIDEGSIDIGHLEPLATLPEVFGFVAAQCRADRDGIGEADAAELLARSLGMTPGEVRKVEAVLRPLGYIAVSDRLREIAGRRRQGLKPLP